MAGTVPPSSRYPTFPSGDPAPPGRRVVLRRERTLERRIFTWVLALTVVPALVLLAAGGYALGTSLGVTGVLGPWEAVAHTGRNVLDLASASDDSALVAAAAAHRAVLSESLTQARRWAFLGDRFQHALPWLTIAVALVLTALAAWVSRRLARELARPIQDLVMVAEHLGREEPLPPASTRSVREVRLLDRALRDASDRLAAARVRALATERVRVWGEMARRVAHEMKNPLTPLRLAAHRLRRASETDESLREAVEVIGEEVGRLEELAAQFSALGRPSEGPKTDVALHELIAGLLETDVPERVEVRIEAPDALPLVRGHYDALVRAFRNLIRNAVEAMDASSEARLTVAIGTSGGGRWLDVRIADTGPGLPAGEADRIFEPDFTTKKRGTGLGLALVRQAVRADGGDVFARDLERGAELMVRLPATEPATAETERTV